jgi:hypothetical protein
LVSQGFRCVHTIKRLEFSILMMATFLTQVEVEAQYMSRIGAETH